MANINKMQSLECILYFLSNATVCFAETYLQVLFFCQGFINFDWIFHLKSKQKEATPLILTIRLSKNLSLLVNMSENNKVIGNGA